MNIVAVNSIIPVRIYLETQLKKSQKLCFGPGQRTTIGTKRKILRLNSALFKNNLQFYFFGKSVRSNVRISPREDTQGMHIQGGKFDISGSEHCRK